jgi:hypothetical protein
MSIVMTRGARCEPRLHALRRKLFARPFSKAEMRRTWETVVKEKTQLAVSRIRGEWWTFLATDVGGHKFGEPFDMLPLGR